MRPFSIRSRRDVGFVRNLGGVESHHTCFGAAAAGLIDAQALATIEAPLMPIYAADGRVTDWARPASVFDAAYQSGIDTALSFDGDVFLVELGDDEGARVLSIDDAQQWLERAIRSLRPDSLFASGAGAR